MQQFNSLKLGQQATFTGQLLPHNSLTQVTAFPQPNRAQHKPEHSHLPCAALWQGVFHSRSKPLLTSNMHEHTQPKSQKPKSSGPVSNYQLDTVTRRGEAQTPSAREHLSFTGHQPSRHCCSLPSSAPPHPALRRVSAGMPNAWKGATKPTHQVRPGHEASQPRPGHTPEPPTTCPYFSRPPLGSGSQ